MGFFCEICSSQCTLTLLFIYSTSPSWESRVSMESKMKRGRDWRNVTRSIERDKSRRRSFVGILLRFSPLPFASSNTYHWFYYDHTTLTTSFAIYIRFFIVRSRGIQMEKFPAEGKSCMQHSENLFTYILCTVLSRSELAVVEMMRNYLKSFFFCFCN